MGAGAKESFRVLLRQLIGGLLLIGGLYGVMKLVTNGNYYFAGFELIRMVIYVFFVSLMLFSAYTGYRLIKNIDSAYTHAKWIYISQIPIISVIELFRWHWTSGISFNIFVKFSENGDPFTSFRFSLGSGYSSNVEETFFAVNLIALFIAVILIYLQKNKNNSKEQYAQLDSVKDTNKIYHKLRIIGLGGLILSVLGGTAFYFYTHLFTKTVSVNPTIKENIQKEKTISKKESNESIFSDSATGLVWQDDSEAKTNKKDWNGAKKHCQNLTLGGYSDWRLPNIFELSTLLDNTKSKEPYVVDGIKNIDSSSSNYWSSTTDAGYTDYAWVVGFYYGVYWGDKTGNYYVRCVSGKTLNFDDLSLLKKSGKIKVSQENIDKIKP